MGVEVGSEEWDSAAGSVIPTDDLKSLPSRRGFGVPGFAWKSRMGGVCQRFGNSQV